MKNKLLVNNVIDLLNNTFNDLCFDYKYNTVSNWFDIVYENKHGMKIKEDNLSYIKDILIKQLFNNGVKNFSFHK